jgi:drug/metabolite transporter (DMT)-like permease
MPLAPHPVFANRKVVFLLATLCCLLWGSSYPAIKNGYALFAIAPSDLASKMVFAGYRFLFAGLLLLVMAAFGNRRVMIPSWKNLREITVLGLTQTSLHYVFFYVGLAYTTGVKASIMNATGTFFSVGLAHFIYANDRLSLNKIAGCLIGFSGVMVVNFNRSLLDFHFTLLGEGFVVIAAFILSAATIYGKKISQKMDALFLTGCQLAVGGAVLMLVGYMTGGTLSGFTLMASALLAYLVLLSSVSLALWAILLKYNRVGMVTVFNFQVPIFGAILSAIFLGENVLEWKNIIALVLVCSGIWLVTKESQ